MRCTLLATAKMIVRLLMHINTLQTKKPTEIPTSGIKSRLMTMKLLAHEALANVVSTCFFNQIIVVVVNAALFFFPLNIEGTIA